MYTTFGLSFERLQAESPAAAQLLSLCAYLPPHAIEAAPFALLGGLDLEGIEPGCSPELRRALRDTPEPERQMEVEALFDAAQRYSLLVPDAARSVSMHRLVQDAVQVRLAAAGGEQAAVRLMGEVLATALPNLVDSLDHKEDPRAPAVVAAVPLLRQAVELVRHLSLIHI